MNTPIRATSRTRKPRILTAQIIPLPTASAVSPVFRHVPRDAWPSNVVSYFGYRLAHPDKGGSV